MLLVPQSIVARWSPLQSEYVAVTALLAEAMDRTRAGRAMSLSPAKAYAAGWQSAAAHRLYEQACARLSEWCVDNRYYMHNVATTQDFVVDAGVSLCLDRDLRRLMHPTQRWRPFKRESPFEARWREQQRCEKRYAQLPTWAERSRALEEGTPVLVAAPLCVQSDEADGIDVFLCDYPDFVRTPHEASVQLVLPPEARRLLLDRLGPGAAWHPFCRILGVALRGPRGLRIRVLRIELSVPLADHRRGGRRQAWDEKLIEETTAYKSDFEIFWARKVLEDHQASARVHAMLDAHTPAAQSQREEILARALALADSNSSHRALARGAGSPFEGMDAFWCATGALLPAWKQELGIDDAKVTALLAAFDSAYDEAWRKTASDPILQGALRYTTSAIDDARARIASCLQPS